MRVRIRVLCFGLLLLLSACAASAMSIQEAKLLPDTDAVTLSGKVVTYAGTGFFYIEEDSRGMGIRVEKAGHSLTVGMRADVVGEMATNGPNNERYVWASSAVQAAYPNDYGTVEPLSMSIKAVGGGDWSVVGTGGQRGTSNSHGLNNTGLLVKTWGQFTKIDATTFTVSDGAGLTVLCTAPSGTFLSTAWQSVVVTGISSICNAGLSYAPLILVRDIRVLTPLEAVSTPGTPSGDAGPLVNLPYAYSTTGATCNWGHTVEYSFNWGDGTSSPWSTSTAASHTWPNTTSRTVTVTARCQSNPSLSVTSAGRTITPLSSLASAPWSMFRHDAKRTGYSPYHDPMAVLTPWTYALNGNGLSSPAVGPDGTIYLAGVNALIALNPDGTFKWAGGLNNSPRSSPAISSDGATIYVGGNGRLYAFNSSNGTQKWYQTVSGDVSGSPVVGPDPDNPTSTVGMVYIGTVGGTLYAITPGTSSASVKWSSTVGGMHITSPVLSANGNTVYAAGGGTTNTLWAFNTAQSASPRVKWSISFPKTYTTPALSADGSVLYAGSGDGNLYSVNTSNGSVNWLTQVGFKAAVTSASPAVGPDGTIYIGSNYGTLYAIDPVDGTYKWIFESRATDIRSSVAVNADNTVILATYDDPFYIRGLDGATGAEKWHHLLKANSYASPAIMSNGAVVTVAMNGSPAGVVYANIWGTPPAAVQPSDLTATVPPGAPTTANLSWHDNSSDEYGFRIERRVGTIGAYSTLTTVAAGTTTYTDSGLQSGMIYYYRVCAYQSGGDSAYSNEAYAVTPGLQTPVGLVATVVSAAQVDLSWIDRAPDELGFKIERSQGPNGLFEEIARVGVDVTTYSDTTTYPARNYYYRVRAYDATRNSSYTNEAWALTPGKDFSNIWNGGNASRNQVALTFDAGTAGILGGTSGIAAILKNNSVFSTFFITGYVTSVQSAYVAELATYGQQICNHTYDHPDLRYCTDQQIFDQLNTADDIIYATSGHHTPSFFRAPYGAQNQHVLDAAAIVGYRHVGWTKDSGDVGGASPSTIVSRITGSPSNGDVDLFHCTQSNTLSALQQVIDTLKAKGFEMVSMPELVAPLQVTTPAGTLRTGWNLISLPIEPALEFPHVVFKGLTINANLKRWDRATGAEVIYSSTTPGPFRNVYADEGYWLYVASPTTFKFNGAAATTNRRMKLQYTTNEADHATYGLIGYPFQTAQSFANCQVYNPGATAPKTRSIADAITAGWIPSYFYGWNNSTTPQVEFSVSVAAWSPTSTQLEPWRGYRAACLEPGCELIIPMP